MKRFHIVICFAILCCSARLCAENITFADANVKALCIAAKWDTDLDGELSLEEAASVKTLGSVFREKTNISIFEELKYFTGLSKIDNYAFYKSSLQKVSFPSSVTTIGEYAFSQSSICEQLVIPGTVKTIGDYAFNSCRQLTSVMLEEGVETVGWHAFSGPISFMSLPTSISYISSMFINPFVNSDPNSGISVPEGDLYLYVRSLSPAAINHFAFYYVFAEAHLIVPFGTTDAYKAVPAWSHFGEYLEAGDVNGDGALNVKDVTSLNAYIMKNAPSPFDERLADVNGDGQINVKDVTLMCNWIMKIQQKEEE